VDDGCRIDTLLLSCRVIGRSLETAFLAHLAEWARARGASSLEGEFVPTARNAPAADFYRRHGFARVNEDSETERWRLRLAESEVVWPDYIQDATTVEQLT
jgi:predicted enzyme involved in methoxymalonyl-ACP biosynthesis